MSAHALYVTAAYALSTVGIVALIGWVIADYRARRRDLALLEASGVRRRSDRVASRPQ
jgi:heme exporter protein D